MLDEASTRKNDDEIRNQNYKITAKYETVIKEPIFANLTTTRMVIKEQRLST
jgi:hypothetical protein